jgi:hypothetical protein
VKQLTSYSSVLTVYSITSRHPAWTRGISGPLPCGNTLLADHDVDDIQNSPNCPVRDLTFWTSGWYGSANADFSLPSTAGCQICSRCTDPPARVSLGPSPGRYLWLLLAAATVCSNCCSSQLHRRPMASGRVAAPFPLEGGPVRSVADIMCWMDIPRSCQAYAQ